MSSLPSPTPSHQLYLTLDQEQLLQLFPWLQTNKLPPCRSVSGSQPAGPSNFVHHPFMDIGMKMQKYNDALGEFKMLGIAQVAVLPELVIVGDQSSGKSTLMSALARLNIPTSSGICTRCPFHIRMGSSSHWSCTVSLQQDYEYHPPNHALTQSDVTFEDPFPPWVPKPMKTIVFKTIHEHDAVDIEEILRWAQVATLNPSHNPKQFVPGEGSYTKETDLDSANALTEARFSPNVVSLEMKGPCFPDISFVDLPGVFALSDQKIDDYLVDVVENLTGKYVGREEAIIVLALPMDRDIDNSRALRIIRELEAESRTIGVLTKADRLDSNSPDSIAYWLSVLDERKQKVKENGFYITSLPPDRPMETLAKWEDSFFRAGAKDWPPDFGKYVNRCGVDQLRDHITKELEDAVACSLPNIKQKFQTRLKETQAHLNEMPDLPRNVEHEVRTSLRELYTSVKRAFSNQGFEEQYKRLTEGFYRHIVQLKPKCIVSTRDLRVKARPEDVVVIDSDDSDSQTVNRKRSGPRVTVIGSTPKRQRRSGLFTASIQAEGPSTRGHFSPLNPASPSARRPGERVKFSLPELHWEIKHKTRGGFSEVVPFELHERLCLDAISQWEEPLEKFIDQATTMLRTMVTEVLKNSLKKFARRQIYKESQKILMTFLKDKSTHQHERLKELYGNEMYRAVTINEEGLNNFKAKEKQTIERIRIFTRAKEEGLIDEDRQLKRLDVMSQEEKLEDTRSLAKWQAQLKEDPFQREIDVIANVRAYYLTAATRFVDGVSMDVNSWLFRAFREKGLDDHMDKNLGLTPYPDVSTYSSLMEEDAATAQTRRQLKREQTKLMTAMSRIIDLETSFTH
ncbi:P-loop containing nucleoside triphosphate hydrolase protein [Xylaria nigripes]|nr:P-loop containing nucleoside triphosphate hydrolase protein [Xylaria nigripes]